MLKLKTKQRIFDTLLILFAAWFILSYVDITSHNLSAMGADYMSNWNLFKILMR